MVLFSLVVMAAVVIIFNNFKMNFWVPGPIVDQKVKNQWNKLQLVLDFILI